MAESKKFFWLRLKRDFFKRHDIEIIEGMPNGKDYVLFYLKLLVESIDHDGNLRFSETLPYNTEMLAIITKTNIDIVRSAVKIFAELGMMEIMDDGTFYMRQLEGMIGDETEWAEKKRIYREEQKRQLETKEGQERTMSDKSKSNISELDQELNKYNNNHEKSVDESLGDNPKDDNTPLFPENSEEKPKRKKNKQKEFVPPTRDEVLSFWKLKGFIINPMYFFDYYENAEWKKVGDKPVLNWKNTMLYWNEGAIKRGDKPWVPPRPQGEVRQFDISQELTSEAQRESAEKEWAKKREKMLSGSQEGEINV